MAVHDLSARQTQIAIPVHADVDPLLALAIEKQMPVEALERIVALVHKQEERKAERSYYDALAQFQAECPAVQKTSTAKISTRQGSAYSYAYAELDEIDATVKGPAHRHGLSWTWDTEVDPQGMMTVACRLHHRDGFKPEPTRFTLPTSSSSAMSDQQRYGAAMTFGQRRTLLAALGMPTTDATPDTPADLETITAEQGANMRALLDEIAPERHARFFELAGAATVEEIPARRYAELMAALDKARRVTK